MSKEWNVKVDDQMYNIEVKGRKLKVNGENNKLRQYRKKTGLIHEEYEIPVGSKNALLVLNSMGGATLVIDNKDCATGEEYVPMKVPGWAYIFIVLHCVNFINGAIGAFLAFVGITLTASISSNRKINVIIRVLLDFVILVLAVMAIFGVALMMV
ncbi:MAG: hypothetical protein HDQ97_01305 [Lachnospiraceae bacterium]|nr:hypothetical protein [Lachnospiraceae bacterium]